jgi:hypothetical protein
MHANRPSRRPVRPWVWLCLFSLPTLLVLGIPAAIGLSTGECFHVDQVVQAQSGPQEVLFGAAYGAPDAAFKLRRTLLEKPQVLVIGSSRVLNIRRDFIRPEVTFYNAGRISDKIWNLRQALMRIPPDQLPSHLIVGIDQYQFNAAACDDTPQAITTAMVEKRFSTEQDGWIRLPEIAPLMLKDILSGKIHPRTESPGWQPIGLAATMNGCGFRNDGSYRYGDVISTPPASRSAADRLASSLKRIRKGSRSFEHGQSIHQPNISEIGELLEWCRKHHIHVIAYLPPYAPSTLNAMRREPAPYAYLPLVHSTLKPLFDRYGFIVHDFTEVPGATDDQFIDGFHPSERVDAEILLHIALLDPVAAEMINSNHIQSLIAASTDPLILIP